MDRERFISRQEDWGYLIQDVLNDRIWAVDDDVWQRMGKADTSLPIFAPNPYRYGKPFILGDPGKVNTLSAPISISWSLTTRCNSRCVFCCTDSINSDGRCEATTEEVENIARVLLEWRVPRMILGGGEPLTRPDIGEILSIFEQMDFKPALATNGVLLDDKMLEMVSRSCMNIQVSLDTLDGERYRRLRGVDALDAVLGHIRAAASGATLTRVVTVLTSENISELPSIGRFLANCGVRQWFIFEMLGAGRGCRVFDELHIRDDAFIRRVITQLQDEHPGLSVWYWGSKPADGCSVYVLPDGSLALTDYHANRTSKLSGKSLSIESARRIWDEIGNTEKRKMLDNFLSSNRLEDDDV